MVIPGIWAVAMGLDSSGRKIFMISQTYGVEVDAGGAAACSLIRKSVDQGNIECIYRHIAALALSASVS